MPHDSRRPTPSSPRRPAGIRAARYRLSQRGAAALSSAEIFHPAIEAPAAAIVVAHSHPSSDPSSSPEDVNVTRQFVQAGKLLDSDCLDHLIIGHRCMSVEEWTSASLEPAARHIRSGRQAYLAIRRYLDYN